MKKILLVALVLPVLAGCVSPAQRAADQKLLNESVLLCRTQKQCDAEWAAASAWVSQHCGMKIQTATDNLIETYNSIDSASTESSCRVNRQPGPGHSAAIVIWVGCRNLFGCVPDAKGQVLAFDEAVKQAGAPYEPLKIGVQTQQVDSHGQPTVVLAECVGVKIGEVTPGGRASAAGLQTGDLVQAFDDRRIRTLDDWTDAIQKYGPGDVITVHVRRDGKDVAVSMPL
jgi:hypothetical protein